MPNIFMFIRKKKFRQRTYYYIVEAYKDEKKPKQRVIKYLGNMKNLLKMLQIADKCLKDHQQD